MDAPQPRLVRRMYDTRPLIDPRPVLEQTQRSTFRRAITCTSVRTPYPGSPPPVVVLVLNPVPVPVSVAVRCRRHEPPYHICTTARGRQRVV